METKKVQYTWKVYLVIALLLIPLVIGAYFAFETATSGTTITFPESKSEEVVGYKLYYELEGKEITTNSEFEKIGKKTKVNLSLILKSGTYNIGIVAYDSDGNESNMNLLKSIVVK